GSSGRSSPRSAAAPDWGSRSSRRSSSFTTGASSRARRRRAARAFRSPCRSAADAVRILHAIHDFLPRHQAGSEVYAFELCRAQRASHDVTVLCADFDPARRHGTVTWRVHDGVPVVEIVNNWVCANFDETYCPPLVADRIAHVLRALQPEVVHVHSLANLSFDLPAMA